MTQREEEQRYKRKIEDLHAQIEQAAKELSQAQISKQDAIRDRDSALKEKEVLQSQVSTIKDEIEKLEAKADARRVQHDGDIASRNIKCKKLERDIRTLQAAKVKLTSDIQKKKLLVKDLASLEKNHTKALASHKKLLADSHGAQIELAKARKRAKQVLDLSEKILSQAKEQQAKAHATQDALSTARKKVLFYANRINNWNKSKNLKPIDIHL